MSTANDVAALIGRILIAIMYIPAGFSKIGGFAGTSGFIASKGLPLPDVGAEEMVGRIRRLRPGLPIVLSSGHHEPIVTSGLREGIATFLPKPWELSQLLEVVGQAM